MGGCLGRSKCFPTTHSNSNITNKWRRRRRPKKVDFPFPAADGLPNRTPVFPPDSEEDAVVKEVLTETPHSSLPPICSHNTLTSHLPPPPGAEDARATPPSHVAATPPAALDDDDDGCYRCCGGDGRSDEAAAAASSSDMCSVSESFCVSAAPTEQREVEEDQEAATSRKGVPAARRRPTPEWSPPGRSCHWRKRPSSGDPFPSRTRDSKSSFARGSSPSPLKTTEGRSFPARDAARRAGNDGGGSSTGASGAGRGERSAAGRRRSVSQGAKRLADLRAARGGGTVESSSSRTRKGKGPDGNRRQREVVEEEEEEGAGGSKETLENPLVSLECFVFL